MSGAFSLNTVSGVLRFPLQKRTLRHFCANKLRKSTKLPNLLRNFCARLTDILHENYLLSQQPLASSHIKQSNYTIYQPQNQDLLYGDFVEFSYIFTTKNIQHTQKQAIFIIFTRFLPRNSTQKHSFLSHFNKKSPKSLRFNNLLTIMVYNYVKSLMEQNMDIKNKIKLSTYISIALTAISTLILTIALIWCFEFDKGYFAQGVSPTLFSIVYFLGVAFSVAAALTIDKKTIIHTSNEPGTIQIPQIIMAIAMTICILIGILMFTSLMLIWSFYGAFAFVIYVLICAAKSGYKSSAAKIFLVYASALFPVTTMLLNNANYMRHVNSVENILFAVFSMAFMSYILYEAKRLYDGTHSRWHFFSMLATLHTGISLSVAYIIAHYKNNFGDNTRFYQMIIVLIISIIVALELVRFVNNANFYSKEEWDEINNPPQDFETEGTEIEETTPEEIETIITE